MKKIYLLLLCSLSFHMALSKGSFHFIPELTGFYSLNKMDFEYENGPHLMNAKAMPGWSLGMSGRLDIKKKAWLSTTLGYRMEPQGLSFYTPDNDLLKTNYFNNEYLYLKILFGFKILQQKTNNFDAGFGLRGMYSLTQREEAFFIDYQPYKDIPSGETLNYLSSFYAYKWGDNRNSDSRLLLPFMLDFVVQAAYTNKTILKSGKMIRVGLEIGAKMGIDSDNFDNSAWAKAYNRQNEQVAKTTFYDRHFTIGLTLGIEI